MSDPGTTTEGAEGERTHALTEDAPASTKPWAALLSGDSLRYHGSGWWLDAALPRSAIGVVIAAVLLPLAWFLAGLAITDDRAAYVETPDVKYQLGFLALHILSLRVMGSMWARGLDPAMKGLGIGDDDQRFVRKGLLGPWANLGAVFAGCYFIGRDTYMALAPDPASGLNAFDDPEMWDFGALGHGVRSMMLGLWHLEWVIYGYLMWLQLWLLVSVARALRRTNFAPHLARLLVHDEYRDFFTLLGKTATVSMVFALGNLAFIHLTGELFPREAVEIDSVTAFLTEMSDLLSTTLLFVVLVGGFVLHLRLLRLALTRAVNDLFATEGDAGLEQLAEPLVLTGDATVDVERLRTRMEAQAGLVRAIAFQREVDAVGSRTLGGVMMKASPALMTTAKRLAKMTTGAG